MLRSARQRCLLLLTLGLGSVSAAAYEPGTTLPRPDQQRGGLVQPQRFALPHAELSEEVRVVVFFYSASWCQPRTPVAAALRQSYGGKIGRASSRDRGLWAYFTSPAAASPHNNTTPESP